MVMSRFVRNSTYPILWLASLQVFVVSFALLVKSIHHVSAELGVETELVSLCRRYRSLSSTCRMSFNVQNQLPETVVDVMTGEIVKYGY